MERTDTKGACTTCKIQLMLCDVHRSTCCFVAAISWFCAFFCNITWCVGPVSSTFLSCAFTSFCAWKYAQVIGHGAEWCRLLHLEWQVQMMLEYVYIALTRQSFYWDLVSLDSGPFDSQTCGTYDLCLKLTEQQNLFGTFGAIVCHSTVGETGVVETAGWRREREPLSAAPGGASARKLSQFVHFSEVCTGRWGVPLFAPVVSGEKWGKCWNSWFPTKC